MKTSKIPQCYDATSIWFRPQTHLRLGCKMGQTPPAYHFSSCSKYHFLHKPWHQVTLHRQLFPYAFSWHERQGLHNRNNCCIDTGKTSKWSTRTALCDKSGERIILWAQLLSEPNGPYSAKHPGKGSFAKVSLQGSKQELCRCGLLSQS